MKERKSKKREIITSFEFPPIPDRRFDWSAIFDDYDGAEDSRCPIGRGPTREAAIADLMEQQEEREHN